MLFVRKETNEWKKLRPLMERFATEDVALIEKKV